MAILQTLQRTNWNKQEAASDSRAVPSHPLQQVRKHARQRSRQARPLRVLRRLKRLTHLTGLALWRGFVRFYRDDDLTFSSSMILRAAVAPSVSAAVPLDSRGRDGGRSRSPRGAHVRAPILSRALRVRRAAAGCVPRNAAAARRVWRDRAGLGGAGSVRRRGAAVDHAWGVRSSAATSGTRCSRS